MAGKDGGFFMVYMIYVFIAIKGGNCHITLRIVFLSRVLKDSLNESQNCESESDFGNFGKGMHLAISLAISRLCDRQRVVKDVRMSRRALWRRADTVAAGYPLHLQQYVRLLALSLTGSLDLAPKYPWINSKRFCGLDWPVERGFTMRGLVRLKLGVLKSMFL